MARKRSRKSRKQPMLFSALNYKLMALGAILITVGFLLMYFENEVLGFISLFISPLMILAGYVIVGVSIMKKSNDRNNNTQTASS